VVVEVTYHKGKVSSGVELGALSSTTIVVHDKFLDLANMEHAPGSPTSDTSEMSAATLNSLGEGDFITGIVDITNERTYMVPPVENWDRAYGKNREVRVYLHLVDCLIECIISTRRNTSSLCKSSRKNIGMSGPCTTSLMRSGV